MIYLKDVTEEDAVLIHKWKQDPYLKEMALDPNYTSTLEQQQNDIRHALKNPHAEYKLILLNTVKPIGYIRIDWMDEEHQNAWLRFALGEDRGRGYATAALKLYVQYLFEHGCHRIEGEVYATNVPSHYVMDKVGFQREGVKREAHFNGSEWIDVYVYGLILSDFQRFNQ